jgi:hypothetical protein
MEKKIIVCLCVYFAIISLSTTHTKNVEKLVILILLHKYKPPYAMQEPRKLQLFIRREREREKKGI